MTMHLTHQPTTVGRQADAPRHLKRWFLPAGIAVAAAGMFVAVDAIRDDGAETVTRPPAVADVMTTDYTLSQRLVDQAIADALTDTRVSTTDYTLSQRLVDQAIADALTDTRVGTTDYTLSQRLVDQAIADALTDTRVGTTDYTLSQRLVDQAIADALTEMSAGSTTDR